jgi:hypothetical protein
MIDQPDETWLTIGGTPEFRAGTTYAAKIPAGRLQNKPEWLNRPIQNCDAVHSLPPLHGILLSGKFKK